MKLTRQQLQKIIQEELQMMAEEEDEVNEIIGGLGGIFGAGKKKAGDIARAGAERVGGAIERGAEKLGAAASGVADIYKKGEEERAKKIQSQKITALTGQVKTIVSQLRGLGLSDNQIDDVVFGVKQTGE